MGVSLFPEALTGRSASDDNRVLVRGVMVQPDQVHDGGFVWFLVVDGSGATTWRRSDAIVLDERPSGGWS
jgi:hypothetical protein